MRRSIILVIALSALGGRAIAAPTPPLLDARGCLSTVHVFFDDATRMQPRYVPSRYTPIGWAPGKAWTVLWSFSCDVASVAGGPWRPTQLSIAAVAIEHPERVRSLTSIMSTLGRRSVGWQHPSLLPMLLANRGAGREAYIDSSARMWKAIGSPGYPQTDEQVRTRAGETYDRGVSASGVMRQMLAILNQPDRSRALGALRLPAAVVHGTADKMVHVSGGRATARAIPGAELVLLEGMGHDTPAELFPTFTEVIRRTADRAARAPGRRTRSDEDSAPV